MSKVLSQEEVDSLLNGIGDGMIETETDVPLNNEEIQPYDFGNRSSTDHRHLPALMIINERFISFINTSLSTVTRKVADVSVTNIDSVKYNEFCRSLPLPTSLSIFKIDPLKGFAILVLEGPLVFGFVDIFFGGNCSGHVKLEGRSFTSIETKIIQKIVGIALEDYQKAWLDVHKVKMEYSRSEVDPQFAGIAKPDDMVISTTFNVDIGNLSGSMTMCIPYNNLEPIKKILGKSYQSEIHEVDQTWRKHFINRIEEQHVNIRCNLGEAEVTGRELLRMKAGDVIMLDQKTNDTVPVYVEEKLKFKGHSGSINEKKALRIETRINME